MAKEIVEAVGEPHFILGKEFAGEVKIDWMDDEGEDEWGGQYPWDSGSGQPNDCDGPGTEPCIFVGPGGRFFDFACNRKVRCSELGSEELRRCVFDESTCNADTFIRNMCI